MHAHMHLHTHMLITHHIHHFCRPPLGAFKVVLATNVAETSITIDDVSFVVDTGRAKEMQHDVDRGILRLQEQWVSQVGVLWAFICYFFCSLTYLSLLACKPMPSRLDLLCCVCVLCSLSSSYLFMHLQASAQQRRGRAGRVRPGLCFRMFRCVTEAHVIL